MQQYGIHLPEKKTKQKNKKNASTRTEEQMHIGRVRTDGEIMIFKHDL